MDNEARNSQLSNFNGISREDLIETYQQKYGSKTNLGWGPGLRKKYGYSSPSEFYETVVKKLVEESTYWIDIGCGRDVFPSNPSLAKDLCEKANHVLGVDPDENIKSNVFIDASFQGRMEDLSTTETFDLATFRMVAEHIEHPEPTLGKLAEIIRPGGRVVIFTPHKWAPISIVAKITPMSWHHKIKKFIWNTEERDTFPVEYKMNTRRDLKELFERKGFSEEFFALIDDCSATERFYYLNSIELCIRRILRFIGLRYPEVCILGVYRKN